LLHGIDIGPFGRLAEPHGVDALVVHATDDGDGRALCLGRTIAMIGGNVEDSVAVRYHISLEAPFAA